jgi:hypothetical protein
VWLCAQSAVQAEGYEVHWHDRRQSISSVSSPPLVAFIVNQSKPRVFSLFHSHHWYPCRAFSDGRLWFDLNSVNAAVTPIPDVVAYCTDLLTDPNTQLLLIVPKGVTREELYTARGFLPPHASTEGATEGQHEGTPEDTTQAAA